MQSEVATGLQRHVIDPFGAMPGRASVIRGVGGGEASIEAGYVFGMSPVAVRAGHAAITFTFRDLQASGGSINIDLIAIASEKHAVPTRIRTRVVALADLTANGGRVSIDFVAHQSTLYAASGTIHGDHEVHATAIDAELIEGLLATDPTLIDSSGGFEPSSGLAPLRLASIDPPSFANPVSQPLTRDQLQHATFLQWARELHLSAADPADAWVQAFVLQALTRYGALAPAARGLGIHVSHQAVPAWLASQGFGLTLLEHSGRDVMFDAEATLNRVARPAMCSIERLRGAVQVERMDLQAPDIRSDNYDFAWSAHLGGGIVFEDSFWLGAHRVRSGGLYVHAFSYDPYGGTDPAYPARPRIERLALNAISFGHGIAELKFRVPREGRSHLQKLPFVLILRHG